MRIKASQAEQLQAKIDEWLMEHPDRTDFTMREVAADLYRSDKLRPRLIDAVTMLERELAAAAREQYYTDPQGRRVRKKHARRETVIEDGKSMQLTIWADITTAEPIHMRVALQQRRQGIVADCAQLKRDSDSYNENNEHGAYIQLVFDFREDLEELEHPGEY